MEAYISCRQHARHSQSNTCRLTWYDSRFHNLPTLTHCHLTRPPFLDRLPARVHMVPGRWLRRHTYLARIPPRISQHGLSQPLNMLSKGTWLLRCELAAKISKMSPRGRSTLHVKRGTIGTTHILSTHSRIRLKIQQDNNGSSMSSSGSGLSTYPALTRTVTGIVQCRLRGFPSLDTHMTQPGPPSSISASSVSRLTSMGAATTHATHVLLQVYNGGRTRVVLSIFRIS